MNKKGLSTWATMGSVVMLGLLLMVGFNVYGSTNEGVGKIILSSECYSQDYDNDSYSNSMESSNLGKKITKPEKSCPCDPPEYSRNVALNPEIWDSEEDEGPYTIFDYDKRKDLKKITSLSNKDYVFLTWYLDYIDKEIPDDADTRSYFSNLKQYMREGVDGELEEVISFKTLCPGVNSVEDCTNIYFKSSWFEDSDPSPVAFQEKIVCETNSQDCQFKMQDACANAKIAKDEGKV